VIRAGVRIPEDLSVIGHDNQPIAAYCPVPLTSMTQPTERIANTVVEMLMDRIRGGAVDTAPQRVTVTSELVQRASVAPPNHF
jgi:DNA-binding LacI/PurR family transcriptional regulator